jgi:hypothetical protein
VSDLDGVIDETLAEALHRADLDALVRLIDARCASRDWPGLLRLRDRARHAVDTGRQLWPAATLAEYRLALLAPAEWAARVLDEGSGRFTLGPLTEVVAQHHDWPSIRSVLEPGPRAALVAHERVLRGEDIDPDDLEGSPDVLELPYRLADWEPAYCLAEYHDAGADFPSPDEPGDYQPVEPVAAVATSASDDDDGVVVDAVRQLVEPWTTSSNGHCDVVSISGTMPEALAALGLRHARVAALPPAEATAWLAWAGASGGAFGRRRGAALGRFGAWWVIAALTGVLDDWPLAADEVGELAGELRWWWFDAFEPSTGWQLQLAVEHPADDLAWAINARDAT